MDLSIFEKIPLSYSNILQIDKYSSAELHKEVYKIADYFQEEFNYGKVPFSTSGDTVDEVYKALLFTEQDINTKQYRIYGGCYFKKMKLLSVEIHWVLQWIWIHPFFRHRGNLKRNWADFEREFHNFSIAEPISNDMKCFLKNINSQYEHEEL